MEDFAHALANFVRDHQAWAAPIVLVLAFGESLAFISLLIPAWGALVAIGAMIGGTGVSLWAGWVARGVGAARCGWGPYLVGYREKEEGGHMLAPSRHSESLPRGQGRVGE